MKKIFCLITLTLLVGSSLSADVADFAKEAALRPIGFSVVREDSLQDLQLINQTWAEDEKLSVAMVASGGDTAALLVSLQNLTALTLVDPNPSQLAVTKLKLALTYLPQSKRLQLLGHLPMQSQERKEVILGLMQALDIPKEAFGDLDLVAEKGIDHIGRYERVFEELRAQLAEYQSELEALFYLDDLQEQSRRMAPDSPLGKAFDKAIDTVMSQDNLVAIFGNKATNNRVQEFSRHFATQVRSYLRTHTAASSPWMALLLLGHFHNDTYFPWLDLQVKVKSPELDFVPSSMNDFLEKAAPESYHVIHLSNILDWLSPEEAKHTLELAQRALKPDGIVIIRQLNSNIEIPLLGDYFQWNIQQSQEYLQDDRSFFYRNFFIGMKPAACVAPEVTALADRVLKKIPIQTGIYFKMLPEMSYEQICRSQEQFFFAVDYFSRPMAALISRQALHKDRIDILHNMVEEHGDFVYERYHSNTFKQFLASIGARDVLDIEQSPAVHAFNTTLMGICLAEDPAVAIACLGIIEYAFADLSSIIGNTLIDKKIISKEALVHYSVHAAIDKRHAGEFFKVIEPLASDSQMRQKIISGLSLGAYIFNRLYDDLYRETLE